MGIRNIYTLVNVTGKTIVLQKNELVSRILWDDVEKIDYDKSGTRKEFLIKAHSQYFELSLRDEPIFAYNRLISTAYHKKLLQEFGWDDLDYDDLLKRETVGKKLVRWLGFPVIWFLVFFLMGGLAKEGVGILLFLFLILFLCSIPFYLLAFVNEHLRKWKILDLTDSHVLVKKGKVSRSFREIDICEVSDTKWLGLSMTDIDGKRYYISTQDYVYEDLVKSLVYDYCITQFYKRDADGL